MTWVSSEVGNQDWPICMATEVEAVRWLQR
jgi:hypothetical protein